MTCSLTIRILWDEKRPYELSVQVYPDSVWVIVTRRSRRGGSPFCDDEFEIWVRDIEGQKQVQTSYSGIGGGFKTKNKREVITKEKAAYGR